MFSIYLKKYLSKVFQNVYKIKHTHTQIKKALKLIFKNKFQFIIMRNLVKFKKPIQAIKSN